MNRTQAEAAIKFAPFCAIWLAFIALKVAVAVLGLFLVPVLWQYRANHVSWMLKHRKWLVPWINPEVWQGGPLAQQGLAHNGLPQWWIDREGISFKAFWKYHAVRNPANGLRNYELLDLDIDPGRVKYVTNEYFRHYEPIPMRRQSKRIAAYLAWQGWRAGCKVVVVWNEGRHFTLMIGWRVQPSDAEDPIVLSSLRTEDAGFATKLLPYRRG